MANKQKTKKPKSGFDSFVNSRNKMAKKRGNDIGPIQTLGTVLGSLAGLTFGPAGTVVGAGVGGAVGRGVGWITGSGDYKTNFKQVSSNACTVPSFSTNSASTVISKKEYLGDVISSSTALAFSINTYAINPGQGATFPWLGNIASNYEEYEFLGLVFEYKSTSGESVASTNTSLGTVIMATEYDSTKPPFASKLQMEDYFFGDSIKPSSSMLHAVECKKSQSPTGGKLYIREGALTGSDLRWTDFGNFSIATTGIPGASTNLGELWVTYKVKLMKPRLPITLSLAGQIGSYHAYRSLASASLPLGVFVSGVGPLAVTLTGSSLSFPFEPLGVYSIVFSLFSGSTPSTVTLNSITGGGTAYNTFENKATSHEGVGNSTNSITMYTFIGTSVGGLTTMTFNNGSTTATNMDIFISQLDSTIT